MSIQRSLILHNDNIRLPPHIGDVHVIHVGPLFSGMELKQQAIAKYQLQQLAESEPDRIVLYASPLGAFRTRIDTLSVLPDTITDIYVRITTTPQASSPP